MQLGQKLIPRRIDFDSSPTNIQSDAAFFLKGVDVEWSQAQGSGEDAGEIKPLSSNYLYASVPLPTGINTVIGGLYYDEATEAYVVVYNSNGDHFVYRIRGNDGTAEVVYNFCKNYPGITQDPADYFSEGRMAIKSFCRFLFDGSKELYKELLMVNKKILNIRIVVEDSIATNSFTAPFFTAKDNCCGDRCRTILVGVPTPLAKIKVVPIAPVPADSKKQNRLLFKMFKFRFVDENAWGQRSEHGIISDPFYNNLAGCSKDSSGQPRCVWIETKTPCPEIVKRTLEVQVCQLPNGGIGTDGSLLSDWSEVFTINLYDQSDPSLKWFERSYDLLNPDFEFFNNGNDIRIKFCNDRECKPIAKKDIRDQNPAPFKSGTVAALGKGLIYGDNEVDFNKLSPSDLAGIRFDVIPTVGCEVEYNEIDVWAVVHNHFDNQNNPIFKRDGKVGFGGFGRKPTIGKTRFEENVFVPEAAFDVKGGYAQTFPEGVLGFRGILAGTKYTAESKQFLWTPSGITEIGVQDRSLDDMREFMEDVHAGRFVLLQKFSFGRVPKGTYKFRIMGHGDIDNLENTSTYYHHTTSFNGYVQSYFISQNYDKEIFIDNIAGNYDSKAADKIAVIADLTDPQNFSSSGSRAIRGYLYEDKDSKQPIEMAEVRRSDNSNQSEVNSFLTDHNGFYFYSRMALGGTNNAFHIQLFGSQKCMFGQMLGQTPFKVKEGTSLSPELFAKDRFPNYVTDLCNRFFIEGKITECVGGGGIEGIAVILGRTRPVYTNSRGEFKVLAHYNNGRGADTLIFSTGGSCNVLDCNCQPINIVLTTPQPACVNCAINTHNVGTFTFQTVVRKGFEHGSRVPIGLKGHDFIRHTDIQSLPTWYIDIPSEQEQGNATYPRIKVTLPPSLPASICKQFSKLTFYFGKNVNHEDFITWAADKVEFVDAADKVNPNNPLKIKIYYRSLGEYNKLRGFNTNTKWKFQDDAGNTRPNDIVEFIQNVDGKYFPPNTIGNVQYDKDGKYFVVDYENSLKDLKDGVKFKIKRPYTCETNRPFYEHHFPINLCAGDCVPRDDDGNVVSEFFLDGFTTYMLPRQIPVVTDVKTQVPATGGGTQELITEKKEIKIYPYNFEHHSPSDTWGDHCFSGGRVNFKNPYEGKKCNRNQLLLTGALNTANDGAINYLHYFSLEDELAIEEQGWGGIQAIIIRDDGQILLICEFTTFTLAYNDDRAVVTADGYVKLPTNNRFSRPDRDGGINYGCQAKDLNTIRRNGPMVMWLDSHKGAIVLHNFQTGVDVAAGSKETGGGIQSWLIPSIKTVKADKDFYWHGCFDNSRGPKYLLTKFKLGSDQFVNNEIVKKIEMNETMVYNVEGRYWEPMRNFTPEYFLNMWGEKKENQFFSFKNGLPYAHHNAVDKATTFLNYFGIQCIPVFGLTTNVESTKIKSYLWNEVYCREVLFILISVLTEMEQSSQVLEGQWEWGEGISTAPYLCDTENIDQCDPTLQNALVDGDALYGRWLKGVYVPNPVYAGEYFKITAFLSFVFAREKSST